MSLNESAMQSHSLHPPDAVQGFDFPNKCLATQKWSLYNLLLALWGLSKRLPNLKITLQEWSSVFKLNLKWTVIFLLKKFRVGIPLKTERVVLFALFTKVSLAFSDKLPKVSYFQNFLLTRLNFCGSLSQQFNITYLLRVQARLSQKSEQVFNFLIAT